MLRSNTAKGTALIFLSAFSYALMSVFVRAAGDLPFLQKALFRNSVAIVVAGVILLKNKTSFIPPRNAAGPFAGRVITGVLAALANMYAINYLPVASANALTKLSPFFAVLLGMLLLGEKVGRRQLLCVLVAFAGSMFLLIPNLDLLMLPTYVGLFGGAMTGGAHVTLRMLKKTNSVDSSVIVFWFSVWAVLVVVPSSLMHWVPMTVKQLVLLLLSSVACTVAQYALTTAYHFAPPKDISIYDCSQIVFAGIMGFLVFGQIPALTDMIAYCLIIAASVLLFFVSRHENGGAIPKEG